MSSQKVTVCSVRMGRQWQQACVPSSTITQRLAKPEAEEASAMPPNLKLLARMISMFRLYLLCILPEMSSVVVLKQKKHASQPEALHQARLPRHLAALSKGGVHVRTNSSSMASLE
jgi:hypothetical protein